MVQESKSLRFILIATVLVVNAFVIALLAYKLSEDKVQQQREVRTATENLALLLDHNVTESVSKIDLSLHELADQLERELRLRGRLGGREMDALLAHRSAWLSGFTEFRVTDASGAVKFGSGLAPRSNAAAYTDRAFFMAQMSRGESGPMKMFGGCAWHHVFCSGPLAIPPDV